MGTHGPVPTLIEWDDQLPPLERVVAEATPGAGGGRDRRAARGELRPGKGSRWPGRLICAACRSASWPSSPRPTGWRARWPGWARRPPTWRPWWRATSRLDEVGRVAVYADMYLAAACWTSSREDFPKLARLVGEEAFARLVAEFLAGLPAGQLLPAGPGRAAGRASWPPAPAVSRRPWLADLARLEWGRVDVFDGPDAPTLDPRRLRGPAARAFRRAAADGWSPPTAWSPVGFAVEEAWRADRPGARPAGSPAPLPGHLLVWRKHTEVLHRRRPPLEAELLADAGPGEPPSAWSASGWGWSARSRRPPGLAFPIFGDLGRAGFARAAAK